MTVVPARKSETLNVGDQEIVIQELSVQFAFEVEVGTRKDSMYAVILEGSTLKAEDLVDIINDENIKKIWPDLQTQVFVNTRNG